MRAVRPAVHLAGAALLAAGLLLPGVGFGAALDRALWLALFGSVFLWLALLPGPLYAVAPGLPGRRVFVQARRPLGIWTAILSGVHGYYGLFGFVGGFEGLRWWSWDYMVSLALGTVAWAILVLLASTSWDGAVARLGKHWKRLHRLVYVAGVLVLAHTASVTIHVVDISPWELGWFAAVLGLMLAELFRYRLKATPLGEAGAVSLFASSVLALAWSTFLIGHHRH